MSTLLPSVHVDAPPSRKKAILHLVHMLAEAEHEAPQSEDLPLRQQLILARRERRMTCRQVGRLFGVSHNTICGWEAGSAAEYSKGLRGWNPGIGYVALLKRWITDSTVPTADELDAAKAMGTGRTRLTPQALTEGVTLAADLGPDPQIADLAMLYLQHVKDKIQPSTMDRKQWCIAYFLKAFGTLKVSELQPVDFDGWIISQQTWKARDTQKMMISSVHSLFNWARRMRLIPCNPVAEVRRRASDPRDAITLDEFRRLLRAMTYLKPDWQRRHYRRRPTGHGRFRQLLYFLLWTGSRISEARRLVWENVDLDAGLATLKQHKTAHSTGKPRVIFLPPVCVRMLRHIKQHSRTNFVFENAYGKPWKKEAVGTKFRRLREKAGLARHLTLYCVRHTFGTVGSQATDIVTLGHLMGHTQIATTAKYVHLGNQAHLAAAAAKVASATKGGAK